MIDKEKVIDYLVDKIIAGERLSRVKDEAMRKFGLSETDYINYFADAKADINQWTKETEDIALDIQLRRLQTVYDYARDSDNIKVMLEVQKEIDRIRGLQQQNIKADVSSDFTVSFQ